MARSRNIKPGFFQNEDLVELPYEYRLLFIGLWTIADRSGRLENRPKKIKMQLFPADDLDVSKALLGLYDKKLVNLYTIDSIEYIEVINFLKHQHPHHKEPNSVIPECNSPRQALDKSRANPSDSLLPITDVQGADSFKPITDSGTSKDIEAKKHKKTFKPPDINQVNEYLNERCASHINGQQFIDHHQARGWIMSNRQKMKDWKAALRTWIGNDKKFNTGINHGQRDSRNRAERCHDAICNLPDD